MLNRVRRCSCGLIGVIVHSLKSERQRHSNRLGNRAEGGRPCRARKQDCKPQGTRSFFVYCSLRIYVELSHIPTEKLLGSTLVLSGFSHPRTCFCLECCPFVPKTCNVWAVFLGCCARPFGHPWGGKLRMRVSPSVLAPLTVTRHPVLNVPGLYLCALFGVPRPSLVSVHPEGFPPLPCELCYDPSRRCRRWRIFCRLEATTSCCCAGAT